VGEVALIFFEGHTELNRQDAKFAKNWIVPDYKLLFDAVVFKNSARVSGRPCAST
jgi:hypothetical protein